MRVVCQPVLLLCCVCQSARSEIVLDDGGNHSITSAVDQPIVIRNNTSLDFSGEVTLVGRQAAIAVESGSRLTLSGGQLSAHTGLGLIQSSVAHMTGGVIRVGTAGIAGGAGAVALADSEFLLQGGEVHVPPGGGGLVSATGSLVTMSGGTVSVACDAGPRGIGLWSMGNGSIVVTGGVIELAGECPVPPVALGIRSTGKITIVGQDFNFPMHEPIEPTEGNIRGTLLDGSEFDWPFERDQAGTIVLVAEPSGVGVLCWGGIGLVWIRRRRISSTRSLG